MNSEWPEQSEILTKQKPKQKQTKHNKTKQNGWKTKIEGKPHKVQEYYISPRKQIPVIIPPNLGL